MFYTSAKNDAILVVPVLTGHVEQFISSQTIEVRQWLNANEFSAKSGQVCIMPKANGQIKCIYFGLNNETDLTAYAKLAKALPQGTYYFEGEINIEAAVFWGLSQYQFDKYKKSDKRACCLWLDELQRQEVEAIVDATNLVRTLINTPTEDMGPEHLAFALSDLSDQFKAKFSQVIGDDLLDENFPAIHVVGRASNRLPRLLRLSWGKKTDPLLCLVGKGVCFDTGGLDIKPSSAMRNMKKDMGGAAHVMGLAQLIMTMNLPIQLEVLIPAVENAVAGNAYRPGDIIDTRKGLTVEIGNTDAEGRVVLSDALALACELKPKLIIDFATLTGAARVAVGLDIAAMFSTNQEIAQTLQSLGQKHFDPIWQLPLHQDYRSDIEPGIADLSNSGSSPYAGAITAALFLESFVDKDIPWVHFDMMAWNNSARPGKPAGGEAMGIRAVYEFLKSQW